MSLETLKSKVNQLIDKAQYPEQIEAIINQSGVLDSTDGTVEEKVERLIDKAEDEKLWYQRTQETSAYFGSNLFRAYTGTRIPRVDLSGCTNLNYFATGASKLQRIDFYIDSKSCTTMISSFSSTDNLIYMKGINTSACTCINQMFRNSRIETIDEPFDLSKVTLADVYSFACIYLREIRFIAETIKVSIAFTSTYLSAESVQSIIDGLAYVESAQKLTLHTSVVAKLTTEQLTQIANKNWDVG